MGIKYVDVKTIEQKNKEDVKEILLILKEQFEINQLLRDQIGLLGKNINMSDGVIEKLEERLSKLEDATVYRGKRTNPYDAGRK